MKANELMIGNYVKDPYGKEIRLVSVDADASMLTPIQLTEEWLLEFGFEKENALPDIVFPDGVNLRDTVLVDRYHYRINDFIVNDGFYSHAVEIKYIHHLQNLYKALTGEELTLKN